MQGLAQPLICFPLAVGTGASTLTSGALIVGED